MKIACIGNMNNMMFPICLYLIDEGYNVTLYYLDEYEHFLPSKELIPNQLKTVYLGWNEATFSEISSSKIKNIFKDFDFFIGTDYAAAYLRKAKIRLDIYMPAGSDLFDWPFRRFTNCPPHTWEINKVQCSRNQMLGIRYAKFISLDYTNNNMEQYLSNISCKGKRIKVLPFHYFNNGILASIKINFALETDFLVLLQSRQAWKYPDENPHNKGNDVLIIGFASFIKKVNANAKLLLLRYGEHIEETENLIERLGIQDNVQWIQQRHKDEIISIIEKADICVGNLNNSFLSYGSVYEALACKTAFMGYREDELYKNEYKKLYPMINVNKPEDVANKLEYYSISRFN